MSLNEEERRMLVSYRLEKAKKAIEHAEANAHLGYWEVTANRLYYACYYAVSALLVQHGHSTQTHNGVIQLFGLHFIKPGIIDKSHGKLYNQLFTLRLTGDYNDSYTLDEEDVMPKIEPAKALIKVITEMILAE